MTKSPLTLAEIAKLIQAELVGDPSHVVNDVADLVSASENDVSFLAHPRYQQAMQRSKAGAILIMRGMTLPKKGNFLLVDHPSLAFQTLINHFHNKADSVSCFKGIHPTAVIDSSVKLGENVVIGPYCVIERGVSIGAGTTLLSHAYVGPAAMIGAECCIHSHVTIREQCVIGNRVILQPGCVIGSCGFGYVTSKDGQHAKLEQVGHVCIEDDVEIGANATIDRARFKMTRIGRGTKIDNQVQIGHGVQIGPNNLIVAQVGIAGSTQTESGVVLGGQVGVAGHIKLGKNVQVGACSGVSKSLDTGDYRGIPAVPFAEFNRNAVYLRNIERFVKKIEGMEEEIEKLKKS